MSPGREHQEREAIYKWANATWQMLGERFPGRETGFCPYAVRWGHSSFFLAADEEAVAIGFPRPISGEEARLPRRAFDDVRLVTKSAFALPKQQVI
jgi:hypothetical protein